MTGSAKTIVALGLRGFFPRTTSNRQRLGELLGHLMLDWAPLEGWNIELWAPQPLRGLSVNTGHSVRGPRTPVIPGSVLNYVVAWISHAVLAVRRPSPVLLAQIPLLGVGVAFARVLGVTDIALLVRVVGRTSAAATMRGKRLKARIIDTLERFVLRQADLVLPIGAFTERLALEAGVSPAKVLTVPYPPGALPPSRPKPSRRSPRILWGGRLVPEKGLDTLLYALHMISDLDAQLDVVGGGPERLHLQALAESLDLQGKVIFHGKLQRQAIEGLLAGAHVAVLPSHCEEGMSRFLVEAGAHGCVLIASNLGGTADVIQDDRSGLLVPPANADALATALRRCLGDADLSALLAAGARQRAVEIYAQRDLALSYFKSHCSSLAGRDRSP